MQAPSPDNCGRETLCDVAADPERAAALHCVVSDFCHLLRNRLNSLQMSLYLARRADARDVPETWEELDREYRAVEAVVDLFQTVCRPMPLTPVSIELGLVLKEFETRWSSRFAGRGLTLTSGLEEAEGLSSFDPSRLTQSLDALACWRLDGAKSGTSVKIRGRVGQEKCEVEWSESGAAPTGREGELPFAALARVASVHGGGMTRDAGEGWRVCVEWPLNASPNECTP